MIEGVKIFDCSKRNQRNHDLMECCCESIPRRWQVSGHQGDTNSHSLMSWHLTFRWTLFS